MNLEKGWVPIQTSTPLSIMHIWQVHGRQQNNIHDYFLHIATWFLHISWSFHWTTCTCFNMFHSNIIRFFTFESLVSSITLLSIQSPMFPYLCFVTCVCFKFSKFKVSMYFKFRCWFKIYVLQSSFRYIFQIKITFQHTYIHLNEKLV